MSALIEMSAPLRELWHSSWISLEFGLVSVWPRDITVTLYVVFQFRVPQITGELCPRPPEQQCIDRKLSGLVNAWAWMCNSWGCRAWWESSRRLGRKEGTCLVTCLPVLLEVCSQSGVIKPLSCFQACDLTDFSTKRAWDRTNRCFDLGLTLKLGEMLSGAVGLPWSACFLGGLVCFF